MKVTTLHGAGHAYACIETESVSLDVLLTPNSSPASSLVLSAAEIREKALRMLDRAALMDRAAQQLVTQSSP